MINRAYTVQHHIIKYHNKGLHLRAVQRVLNRHYNCSIYFLGEILKYPSNVPAVIMYIDNFKK